jgi:AmmeMemoRadiSam system protein B
VAGAFYPSDPGELRTVVETLLGRAVVQQGPAPRALVVPHAGYIYSGPVAASAYAQLLPHGDTCRRVVLLGPAHHVTLRGMALPGVDEFTSPLGPVPLDRTAIAALDQPGVTVDAHAHRLEHSLEVQLPFLQIAIGTFELVPLVVGLADTGSVARVIDVLWDLPSTLVVISTDLSHYLGSTEARARDRKTCRSIEAMDPAGIGHSDACGAEALKGLLTAARRRGLTVRTLDLRNSADTAGSRDRVVGYGAWMFVKEEPCNTST